MREMTPTVSETREDLRPGRPPVGQWPLEETAGGDPVMLRGAAARPAAPAPVVTRRATVTTSPAYRLVQSVWMLAAVVESIIGLRVLFHAVSANGGAAVVRFIDFIGAPLLAPFSGIVNDNRLGNGGMLDISALITMAVYLVAAFIVALIIRIVTAPRTAVPV